MMTLLTVVISAQVLCTNFNWQHSERCNAPVQDFSVVDGEATGVLTSGVKFTQTNVVNELTRLQRFQMEDAFWYISDRGIINADTDLQALSIYLTK